MSIKDKKVMIIPRNEICYFCNKKKKRKILFSKIFKGIEYVAWICGDCLAFKDQYGIRYLVIYLNILYGRKARYWWEKI